MQTEIIIAGFGGQGVMFAGQLLSYGAMDEGREVTWIPSYGPEMRGGTANCTVIISEEEIGSPLVLNPTIAMVMNLPSLDKYEPLVKTGGLLVINSSLVNRSCKRDDIKCVSIPASEVAEKMGDKRLINMVMLGGMLRYHPVLQLETIDKVLSQHLIEHDSPLFALNIKALNEGAKY